MPAVVIWRLRDDQCMRLDNESLFSVSRRTSWSIPHHCDLQL